MEALNFRNLYRLLRGKVAILFILSVCLSVTTNAQQFKSKDNLNFMDFQKKPYYFGISIGMPNAGFQVNRSQHFVANDTIRIVEGANEPGGNIHLITNVKIGDYFDFRALPGFSFTFRSLEYTSNNKTYNKKVEGVHVEIPLMLRFKSAPYKDKRLFVVGGVKYSYDVASNSAVKKERAKELVLLSPHDFQIEVGAGIQFFFPYFIFSPEIKFSQGISNIHIYKDELNESRILDNILSQILTVSFHFEG